MAVSLFFSFHLEEEPLSCGIAVSFDPCHFHLWPNFGRNADCVRQLNQRFVLKHVYCICLSIVVERFLGKCLCIYPRVASTMVMSEKSP